MVLTANAVAGVNVAVVPEYATAPTTEVVPCFNINVEDVIVNGSIAPLNVMATTLPCETAIALSRGSVAPATGKPTVVKLHTLSAESDAPDDDLAPEDTVAV